MVFLKDEEKLLLKAVPADGRSISNPNIRTILNWKEENYLKVRDGLLKKGLIVLGRGRGGTVRRVESHETTASNASLNSLIVVQQEVILSRESDLYAPMMKTLDNRWVKDQQFDSHEIGHLRLPH